jgi:hypothetical protein
MRPAKSKQRHKLVRQSLEDLLVHDDSPIWQFFSEHLANSKEPPMELDELVKLLDQEMGERTLTEDLYKMRHEESL